MAEIVFVLVCHDGVFDVYKTRADAERAIESYMRDTGLKWIQSRPDRWYAIPDNRKDNPLAVVAHCRIEEKELK